MAGGPQKRRLPKGIPAERFAGKWGIERVLGYGGMGVVYAASHARLGHRVALKVLSEELCEHPELVARFEREARATSALSSPHAVRVHDIDVTSDGTPYIVMELLEGSDLARLLDRDGAQPVGRAVGWVLQACDVLAEAHGIGIVHRDIKPSNLFLARVDGRTLVKVLDFGIAKQLEAPARDLALTMDVAPLGTPHYMSPEQVRCARLVDARSDVWSLGVTLFELLTGETPYMHASPSACIAAIAADPVRDPRDLRPDLPEDLVDVLMRALRKDPDERWRSVEELATALAPFADAEADSDGTAETSVVRVGTMAMPRRLLETSPTLGDSDVDAPNALFASRREPPPPPLGPDVHPGDRRPYGSDHSVPPAISRASDAERRRTGTRLVALTAGLLCLGGLAALPKCTPGMGGAPSLESAATMSASSVEPLPPAPDAPPALDDGPLDSERATVAWEAGSAASPVVTAVSSAVPAQARLTRPRPSSQRMTTQPPRRGADALLPATREPDARPRVTAPSSGEPEVETPVHGGLRGPGF